jgi:hypothetical protein
MLKRPYTGTDCLESGLEIEACNQIEVTAVYVLAFKVLGTLVGAAAAGGGVALFVIAKQDGSRTGQILGVAIPIVAIISAVYFLYRE